MPYYLILCQSAATAQALEAWRELLGGEQLYGSPQMPSPIVFDPSLCSREGGAIAYQTLVQRIEAAASLNCEVAGPSEVVVMVDSVRPVNMSAIAENGTWNHLIALLILTFPDIHWVFGVAEHGGQDPPAEDHNLSSLLTKARREPLLDPTGLREWVKNRTNNALKEGSKDKQPEFTFPERRRRAASIDEEVEFAFMHGYTAFRYGFRTDLVTSWSLMQNLFGEELFRFGGHGYSLIFEDMRLNFYDKPSIVHLSMLGSLDANSDEGEKNRSDHCPCLSLDEESQWRFLITTGQMGSDKGLVGKNKQFLDHKSHGRGNVLYKPVGGIIDLWENTGLMRDLMGGCRAGNADGFIWPPSLSGNGLADGHGSPGKLALVAHILLRRADEIRKGASTAKGFIRGAVLALEATELLGGKTPTLTFSGLALRHELEVRAECAFVGAGYHFGLKRRLEELEEEVEAVARLFHDDISRKSADARVSILNRLVLVFREAGRMEEEQECLVALRRLNRKMSAPKSLDNRKDVFAWSTHWVLYYGEWLLESFGRIAALTASWIIGLSILAWLLGFPNLENPIYVISGVIGWFFGGSPELGGSRWLVIILSWAGVITGIFHLGILISYLYSLIARK